VLEISLNVEVFLMKDVLGIAVSRPFRTLSILGR
jgi:hypothetical protein